MYYNERVAPGLVAVDSPANPFRWPIGVTAEAPAYLDYVHASISAFHRIVQRRARDSEKGSQLLSLASSSPDPEEATFCHYRASALRGLNDALCKPTKNINVAALAGAMMLLFAQLQQGAYGHWRIHLDGFKTLINLHGGYECLIKERRRVSFVLTNVPIIDVISTTTSPVKKMNSDTIVWHMSYLKGLPQLDYDLGPTPAPIPQSLLKPIIMTNLARARSHHAAGQFQVPRFTLSEVMAELDAGVPSNHASHETMPVDHSQDSTFDYGLFVNCFRSAIALYSVEGYTSIESTNENPPDVSLTPSALKNIRNLAYDSLMQALRKIFRLKTNQDCKGGYWKFILWPLVIAGVQNVIVKRNRNDHDFICERLYEMAVDLGTLSMRDAAVFLNRFWDDMIASGVDGLLTNWDDIFVDAPLFLL
ncbi:transcription factor domain-containing protein [Aspergillus undulatus]|uniref:transcription factor domain-containing protein n=1 Tax=Aspergillus undulatus TaxID=1810928 RepID=UPI003CCDC696